MLDFRKVYGTLLDDMLHLLLIMILLDNVKSIGFAPFTYFKLLLLIWISTISFSIGSAFSTMEFVLGGNNLPLISTSSLQIIHCFSSLSTQDDSYLYYCWKRFLSVSMSFVVSHNDLLFFNLFLRANDLFLQITLGLQGILS